MKAQEMNNYFSLLDALAEKDKGKGKRGIKSIEGDGGREKQRGRQHKMKNL